MDQLGQIITLNALRAPNRIAVKVLGGPSITYRELDRRTTKLANALLGSGLQPGDRIAAWLEDCIEYVETYFAAAKAGLVMVPVNERFKTAEARYQVQRTGAAALVYSSGVIPHLLELLRDQEIKLLVGTQQAAAEVPGALAYENFLAKGSESLPPMPPETAPFSICFTSGTTGFPKGATLTHRSLHNVARTQAVGLRLSLASVQLQVASMSFPATFGSHICSHAYVGGTTVLMRKGGIDAEFLLRVIAEEGINHFYLPTPLLDDFARVCARDRAPWRSLQSVLHAGSRAEPRLLAGLADVIGRRFVEGWGMSEISGGIATATSPIDLLQPGMAKDLFASVGRPVPDTVVEIVDANRNPLPHDGETVGELAVRSSSLMRGYWADDDATARSITDGWYYSGDLGRIDEAGYVYIVDRRQDLIISGGMNIYPAELESVISALPGVAECVVVGQSHPRWGQTPVAMVVRSPGSTATEEELISAFASRMANYKKPTRVVFIAEVPRHPTSNKVLRNVLRDRLNNPGSGS